jgi:hypothetical protein
MWHAWGRSESQAKFQLKNLNLRGRNENVCVKGMITLK